MLSYICSKKIRDIHDYNSREWMSILIYYSIFLKGEKNYEKENFFPAEHSYAYASCGLLACYGRR